MKKVFVFVGAVLVSGCFVCHKSVPKEEPVAPEVVQEQPVVPEPEVFARHSFGQVATFGFDSKVAQIDPMQMEALDKDIKAHPDAMIVVQGHTDNKGPAAYNKRLSIARARSVEDVLKQKNYPNQIQVEGYGYDVPIASNDTKEGRAKNRRVDVLLVKDEHK